MAMIENKCCMSLATMIEDKCCVSLTTPSYMPSFKENKT